MVSTSLALLEQRSAMQRDERTGLGRRQALRKILRFVDESSDLIPDKRKPLIAVHFDWRFVDVLQRGGAGGEEFSLLACRIFRAFFRLALVFQQVNLMILPRILRLRVLLRSRPVQVRAHRLRQVRLATGAVRIHQRITSVAQVQNGRFCHLIFGE